MHTTILSEYCKTLQSLYNQGMLEKKRQFLNLDSNANMVRDDVISGGRLFDVLAAARGNTRSPMVRRQVDGTSTAEVDIMK